MCINFLFRVVGLMAWWGLWQVLVARAYQPPDLATLQASVNAWIADPATEETKHGHISLWDTSLVTSFVQLFYNKDTWAGDDLNFWDVSHGLVSHL